MPTQEEKIAGITERSPALPLTDSLPIPDPLNQLFFKITITATADKNTFNIHAAYGHHEGTGTMIMPRHSRGLTPALRRTDTPMTFMVGFHQPNDEKFYDYYEVNARNKNIEMKYVKAYSFSRE